MNFKIVGTTVTELCQTEGSGTVNGIPTLSIKKKECIEDGRLGSYPYYSGNSFRGIMHREIASYITKRIGTMLSPSDYHLNFAGGGSNFQDQTLDTVEKIRELNPLVSVFGASLAIEGKLMVSNLEPSNKFWRDANDGDYRYSGLRSSVTYTKVDDLIKAGVNDKYSGVVSHANKEEYLEINSDIQEARALAREKAKKGDKSEKIKKASIQSFNKAECIIIGATLVNFIGEKIEFTKIERGLLLKAIELMMSRQLGGLKNKGYGVMSYSVQVEDETSIREVMSSSKNDNDIYNPIVSKQYSDEEQECLDAFESWLDSATAANLEVSKLLS